MNAKRLLVVLLIGGLAAVGAFASGDREEDMRPGPRGAAPPERSEETVTLNGKLYFDNRIHPELESGGTVYELLVPRFYAYELNLEEGQRITVEGYTVQDMPCWREGDEEETHIWVTRAVIDGKEYDLENLRGRRWGGPMDQGWGMGPGYGMMGPGRHPHGYRGW